MGKLDAVKRILVLQLVSIEFLLDVAGYAFIWFYKYKKLVEVQFWQKGDTLVIVIYAAILFAFFFAYGAGKIGSEISAYADRCTADLFVNLVLCRKCHIPFGICAQGSFAGLRGTSGR